MDKYSPGRYDPVSGNYFPADLGKTNEEAANLANTKTADAFTVKKSGLNVLSNALSVSDVFENVSFLENSIIYSTLFASICLYVVLDK